MITFLQGTLEESWPGRLVINVGGVGYEVTVPLFGDERFGRIGEDLKVLTHHHIREQEQTLYGFADEDGRSVFRLLIDRVTGIGPKVAMSVLSGMSTPDFKAAVVRGDLTTLAKIKGLGRKTAERIVLELGDKVGVKEAWQTQGAPSAHSPEALAKNDALLGLLSLGFRAPDAQKAIDSLPAEMIRSDEMLRAALRLLQG